jgi:multicomponent Na+:H+ antiporter subunit D
MTPAMQSLLLILPIVLPLLSAALGLLFVRSRTAQFVFGVGGSAALCLAGCALLAAVYRHGILTTALGSWPAPFGIVLVADLFSAVMVCLAGGMALIIAIYACADIDARRIRHGFFSFYNILMMGVCGAFLTGDIFNLFVWFEVMLMTSFVLLVLGGGRAAIEGAVKYVALNLLSSVLFLSAVGILYGKAGTLNMADLAVKLEVYPYPPLITAVALMFLTSFGIKAGIFPLFFWLPAAYHTPPVTVTTLFSALLTKVGIYALVRMFTLVFHNDTPFLRTVFLWLAVLTMVTGVLGAVAQYDFRRLLSFHIISQIGYLLFGLALAIGATHLPAAQLALASVLYFTVHVALAKSALFLISGAANRLRGTFDLKQLGGLYAAQPLLAGLFLVSAMALAGIPPLSGFFAKFGLIRAGLLSETYLAVAAALVVSLLTLFSMTKIWAEAFWKAPPAPNLTPVEITPAARAALYGPIVALAALCVVLGVFAEPFFALAMKAAGELLNPRAYIEAVLGSGL